MKKLIISILLSYSMLFSGVVSIEKQNSSSYGGTQNYTVICSNGKSGDVYENNFGKNYGTICALNSSGVNKCKSKSVWSISLAAQTACKFQNKMHKSKIVTIKNKSLVFLSKQSIEYGLSRTSTYDTLYLVSSIGGGKNEYFRLNGDTRVEVLKKYAPYKIIVDKNGNYQKNTSKNRKKVKNGKFKMSMLVSGYLKVEDSGNNILYVRLKDIK